MTDNDPVLELYNRGISAHDLRSSYVGDQLGDNPYVRFSRQQIEREKRELQGLSSLTGREMDGESFDLSRALDVLEEAESKASEVLSSGQVVGLGLTDAQNLSPKIVPRLEWPFLTIDFEKSSASGPELDYVGLRFVHRCDLTDQQLNVLQRQQPHRKTGQQAKKGNVVSLDLQANDWTDVTWRFLKASRVGVGIQGKEQCIPLGALGLINKTTGDTNVACDLLLRLANQQRVSSEEKHLVSNVRILLQELFGLYNSDPFHIEEGRGYVPNFQLIDDQDALDWRAKKRAVHVPFNDERHGGGQSPDDVVRRPSHGDDQDGHSYEEDSEMQNDEASAWLKKEMSR